MEKRLWEKINKKTSILGFGAMRLKMTDGVVDEEEGFKLFDLAIEKGINYFDTAYPYSNKQNETFVGKALKRYPRDKFFIATKFSLFCFDSREEAVESIDMQLKNLQTDYIDFYLIHSLDRDKFELFKNWNLIEVIKKWKRQGKIKHIGFSFHDSYDVFVEILDYHDWEFVQIQLNYMDTKTQQGIEGYYELEKRGIPVVIMEPLKGGKLATFNDDVKGIFKKHSDNSCASYALRYLGSLKNVKVILSGMKTVEDLEDNVKTFTDFKPLTEEEYKLIDEVKEKLAKLIKINCTDCKYCMPCSSGVNIPSNFKMYNNFSMYQNKDDLSWNYNVLKKANALFSACTECQICVELCPQGIDVPEELKKIAEIV